MNQWAEEVLACDFSSLNELDRTKHLFVLAWLEEFFRAGLQINSPIYAVESDQPNALVEAVDDHWANDVQMMIESLDGVIATWNQEDAVFGPTFMGSFFIGGADADLITGETLVEVKTTKNPNPDRRTFCQLAGYLLLDFIDQYNIQRVGICSGRIGTFKSWDADEYLSKLAGEDVRVDVARDELKAALSAQSI